MIQLYRREIILATVHPSSTSTTEIRALLDQGVDVLVKKYGDELENELLDPGTFVEFSYELSEIQLLPEKMVSIIAKLDPSMNGEAKS